MDVSNIPVSSLLSMAAITVEIIDSDASDLADAAVWKRAVETVLRAAKIDTADVRVALVNDLQIAALNEQFLGHVGPTDVLTFTLHEAGQPLEAEIVISYQTAAINAPRYGWSVDNELLLYLIHGALHLVGYDDQSENQQLEMRQREQEVLRELGVPISTEAAACFTKNQSAVDNSRCSGGGTFRP